MRQAQLSGARTTLGLCSKGSSPASYPDWKRFSETDSGLAYLDTALQQVVTAGKTALWQAVAARTALLGTFASNTAFPSQDTIRSTAHTGRTMAWPKQKTNRSSRWCGCWQKPERSSTTQDRMMRWVSALSCTCTPVNACITVQDEQLIHVFLF